MSVLFLSHQAEKKGFSTAPHKAMDRYEYDPSCSMLTRDGLIYKLLSSCN